MSKIEVGRSIQTTRINFEGVDAARARRATANRTLTVLEAALNRARDDCRVASDGVWREVRPFKG